MADFEIPAATAPGGAVGSSPGYSAPASYSPGYQEPGAGFAPPSAPQGPAEEKRRESSGRGCRCSKKTSVRNIILIVVYYLFKFGMISYLIVSAISSAMHNPFGIIVDYAVPMGFMVVDFWVSKNLAGRCLGRLRWHTYTVKGRTYLHYEYDLHPEDKVNKFDRMMLWLGLWLGPILWALDFISFFFQLNIIILPVPILGLYLTSITLSRYLRCSSTRKKVIRQQKIAERKAATGGADGPAAPSFTQQMAAAATTAAVNAAVSNYV